MKDMMRPLLTIGIIFKNEIRCLERCLKSLKTLRQAIPCELIMADTGANDGSREVAANYADVLFDFPWTEDFSAARNAVMDRAKGQWYLTIDADEYLDKDIHELKYFLQNDRHENDACTIVQRNYDSLEMNKGYGDFMAIRLLRMSTRLRYTGNIHELWPLTALQLQKVYSLSHTVLHHDGYADTDGVRGKNKRRRNLNLIRKNLNDDPNNLTVLLQYVESSRGEPEHISIIYKALAAIEEKKDGWENVGAIILRHAVRAAKENDLSELNEWISWAEEWFPKSFFTRIDVEYIAFSYNWDQEDYGSCIRRGERCLSAFSEYWSGKGKRDDLLYGAILMSAPYWAQTLKLFLANSYLKNCEPDRCKELLAELDWNLFDAKQIENYTRVLREYHSKSREDTAPILLSFWNNINQPTSNREHIQERVGALYRASALAFTTPNRKEEERQGHFCRPSYTLFLPLKDKCDIGRGAAVLTSEDAEEMYKILNEVEEWGDFPPEALSHALSYGITFPLAEHPLKLEEMDTLAGRMASDKESFYDLLRRTAKQDFLGNLQKTAWLRGLALAAVRIFDWDADTEEDIDTGIELARLFARIEETFIPDYYQPELLHKENLCLLPPLHRLGWYCAQAFKALDGGDTTEYIRSLHAGLNSCREGKAMIGFLTEHIPQLQRKEVSPELKDLAEQVRMILSAYPVDAPEIRALKNSPVYQQVAWLIEG